MKQLGWVVCTGLLVSSSIASAQAEPPSQVSSPTSVVVFPPGEIDGNVSKPDIPVVLVRGKAESKNLIRMRSDFRAEVLRSPSRL
ncbi:MAG: hypothetical protein HY791_40210 [Deltaproteobacteria bacterium]|nr:hypothetical protein [Deltaproteobacteria bacterium]